jgi:hypothetical protein
MLILQPNKLVESSILLRGHPPRDLGVVEVAFILGSLGISCIKRTHSDVWIVANRVVSLKDRYCITKLLAIGRKVRFLNLGGDHLAETVIMSSLPIVVST